MTGLDSTQQPTGSVVRFTHSTVGQRVAFGTGSARELLLAEVTRSGAQRVLVIAGGSSGRIAEQLTAGLPIAERFNEVRPHVPQAIALRARAAALRTDADLVISIGGGSATGLAKAVALTSGIPIIAVPTTYAGSEATDMWGITEHGRKATGSDPAVLPTAIVYDAALTLGLPVRLSVESGLNAVAHCVDAIWAPRADPINRTLAVGSLPYLRDGLRAIHTDPAGLPGREHLMIGAYLAAVAFASAGSGLHHKICHVLGGAYDLPHAAMHAVLLPYVVAFNAPASLGAEADLNGVFGSGGIAALVEMRNEVGAPRRLADLGLREDDLDEAAALVVDAVPASNPRALTLSDARRIVRAAWAGEDPKGVAA